MFDSVNSRYRPFWLKAFKNKLCFFPIASLQDVPWGARMVSDGSAEWLVRGVWATATFRSLASCLSWLARACTRSVSPAVNKVSRTRETCAQQRRCPHASTSASLARSRNRSSPCQSCVARSRDQCFGKHRRPSFEVVAGGFIECQKSHPGCPSCGAIGNVHSIHRVPGSASRNPIWKCKRSKLRPGWRQSLPKGKHDWKHCAQKRDWCLPLNHQRRGFWGRIEEDGCD